MRDNHPVRRPSRIRSPSSIAKLLVAGRRDAHVPLNAAVREPVGDIDAPACHRHGVLAAAIDRDTAGLRGAAPYTSHGRRSAEDTKASRWTPIDSERVAV